MKQIIKLTLRNIQRHPGKNICVGIVICCACLMFFVSASITDNARVSWKKHFSTTFLGRYHLTALEDLKRDYTLPSMELPEFFLSQGILDYLDQNGLTYSKRLKIGAAIYNNATAEFEGCLANVVGIDFNRELKYLSNLKLLEGSYDPDEDNSILVWEEFARFLGWNPGDEITLYIKDIDGDAYPYTFTVTGIVSQHHEPGLAGKGVMMLFPLILVDYETIAGLLGLEDEVMEVAVWDNNAVHQQNLEDLAQRCGLQFFHSEEGFGVIYGIVDFVKFMGLSLEIFILIVLMVASFNINMIGFLERRREIGAMMAMGAKPRWIIKLLFAEMIVFSTVAFLFSFLVYMILIAAGAGGIDLGELSVMFAGGRFYLNVIPLSLLYAYVTIAATMLISTLYPAYLTTQIDPVEVFREVNV